MGKMDERILVVERKDLFDDEFFTFQGLLTSKGVVKQIMKRFNKYKEVRRGDAEEDVTLKQPIPYAVLTRGDDVFVYKRLSGGGETRLHDQLSIGVGGHMNRVNDIHNWDDNLKFNLVRELHEELIFMGPDNFEFNLDIVGLINDDNNDVGLHHIGILMTIDIPEDVEVAIQETDELEGHWVKRDMLLDKPIFNSLESWSQIVVEGCLC